MNSEFFSSVAQINNGYNTQMILQYRFIVRWENSLQHIPLEYDEKMVLLFFKKQQEVSRGHSLPESIHTSVPYGGVVDFEVL